MTNSIHDFMEGVLEGVTGVILCNRADFWQTLPTAAPDQTGADRCQKLCWYKG